MSKKEKEAQRSDNDAIQVERERKGANGEEKGRDTRATTTPSRGFVCVRVCVCVCE
jgi:hypothetical protein